jgi:hypothetical protein
MQTFRQLSSLTISDLRPTKDPRGDQFFVAFRVTIDEEADGIGGPYRLCFSDIVADLQDVRKLYQGGWVPYSQRGGHDGVEPTLLYALPLFVLCPNAVAQTGDHQDAFVVRATATSPSDLAFFEFLGRLFGLAMRTAAVMPLQLTNLFWKPLVGENPSRQDILGIILFKFCFGLRQSRFSLYLPALDGIYSQTSIRSSRGSCLILRTKTRPRLKSTMGKTDMPHCTLSIRMRGATWCLSFLMVPTRLSHGHGGLSSRA